MMIKQIRANPMILLIKTRFPDQIVQLFITILVNEHEFVK